MNLVKQDHSAHWYQQDGTPRYDATLREARKQSLLPSVSTICRLWPKGALESWKQTQMILAALTLPRNPGETDDAFAARVVIDGQSTAKTTAEWGTRFHDMCEKLHEGEEYCVIPDDLYHHYHRYREWYVANIESVVRCEHNVVNLEHGYAGKLDLLAMIKSNPPKRALGDIKSRSVKNARPVWYDEQPMQLVAYGQALPPEERPECYFSIIVNRDVAEPPYVHWWTEDEIIKAWHDFLCLRDLWVRVNRYSFKLPVSETMI